MVDPVLTHMGNGGVGWVRVPILWSSIQPDGSLPPAYVWGHIDSTLGSLVDAGFTPIGVIYSNPSWAASTPCGPVDRVPLLRFEQFIGVLVERYDGDGVADAPRSPVVRHWEISNEEDFNADEANGRPDHGGCFGHDPAAYGVHLKAAHSAAKGASDSASIIFGGVAYDLFYNVAGYSPSRPDNPFNYNFVGDVLTWLHWQHGGDPAWPFFDAMALHIYNDYRNNWDGTPPVDQELIGKVGEFRDNQLFSSGLYDLRSTPLMLTEASLPSMPSDSYTERSEAIQAAYPGQLMARAIAVGAENVVWFTIEDSFTGPCNDPWSWLTFGLLRSEKVYQAASQCQTNPLPGYVVSTPHEPKDSFAAYRTAYEQLRSANHDVQFSAMQTGSPQIEAHRYFDSAGSYVVVAFTDNGERLGRRGSPPVSRSFTLSASLLPDWTGSVAITDHLGTTTHHTGTTVTVTLGQEPIYARSE